MSESGFRLRQQLAAATQAPVAEDNVALNRMLQHLWPYLAEHTTKELASQLEPSIRLALSRLPAPLNRCSVDLQRSTLGTRPLRLLAPHASWSGPTTFTISLRLEWDSDSSVYLMFTGATLGIVNLTVVGNLIVEFLLCSGGSPGSLRTLLSGLRLFFPTPPDSWNHFESLSACSAWAFTECKSGRICRIETCKPRISSLISIVVNWHLP